MDRQTFIRLGGCPHCWPEGQEAEPTIERPHHPLIREQHGTREDETGPTHAAMQLVGGLIPAHVLGAYPMLRCCGGNLGPDPELELETRAAWGDR